MMILSLQNLRFPIGPRSQVGTYGKHRFLAAPQDPRFPIGPRSQVATYGKHRFLATRRGVTKGGHQGAPGELRNPKRAIYE